MKRHAIALIAVALAPNVASAKVVLDVRADKSQASRMLSGTEAVTNSLEQSVVAIVEDRTPASKRLSLIVIAENGGAVPFNFGPENISLSAKGKTFLVLTYDQLAREERNKANWRRVAGVFAAASNSANAENAGQYSGSFSAHGNNGGFVHGTYSGYDAGAANQAQAATNQQNAQMMANIRRNEQAALARIGTNMRTTTVDPGQFFGGKVSVELPKELRRVKEPTPVHITVTVGGDVHHFRSVLLPARKQ